MRKYYYIIAAVVVLVIGFFLLQKEATYVAPSAGENIIVFGDSLAYGQGSTDGHDLASLLAQKTGLPVINAGINGDTAISALPRLERDVLQKNPKVVIILLGGNDFFRRIPEGKTMTAVRTIVDEILKTGSGVILVNENKIFATRPLFEQLANEKRIPYIEHVLDGIIGNDKLMSDQIHPNNAGYEIMAEKIKKVLEDYLI